MSGIGLVMVLLVVPTPAPGSAMTCAHGTQTTLEIRGPSHRFRVDQGLAVVASDGKEIWSARINNASWVCLGFDVQARRYLVAKRTSGPRPFIYDIAYLSEDGNQNTTAVVDNFHRSLDAFAVVVSPLGRHVAFVGGRDGAVDGLYVLDTQRDEVNKIGDPPAPPPGSCDKQFGWACGDDDVATLGPSMMRFTDEDTLVVSYGGNGRGARAKGRTTKAFTLWPWLYIPETSPRPDPPPPKRRALGAVRAADGSAQGESHEQPRGAAGPGY